MQKGLNQQRILVHNRALVLNILRGIGVASRAQLARESGLQQATITNITKELIARGFVRETGYLEGERGRRSTGLEIDESSFRTVAARLTRYDFTVGLFTIMGTELAEKRQSVSVSSGSIQALSQLGEVVNTIVEEAGPDKVLGLGLAVPGPFLRDEEQIVLMSGFPGWANVSLRQELEQRVKIPIVIEHDANAGALAEWWLGAGRGRSGSMMYVVGGLGVGAGIVVDGTLFRGATGTAGEMGHHSIDYNGPQCECGNRGCLELYCSTRAIVHDYQQELARTGRNGNSNDSFWEDVLNGYRAGEATATKVVNRAGERLAVGLANMVNVVNPDLIVLGDELPKLGERFFKHMSEQIRSFLLPSLFERTELRMSSFADDAMIRGMAMIVAERNLRLSN